MCTVKYDGRECGKSEILNIYTVYRVIGMLRYNYGYWKIAKKCIYHIMKSIISIHFFFFFFFITKTFRSPCTQIKCYTCVFSKYFSFYLFFGERDVILCRGPSGDAPKKTVGSGAQFLYAF